MAEQSVTVSELLRSIDKADAGDHNVATYARAMKGFMRKATSVLAIGGDTVSLILEDGDILKVGTRTLEPEMGNRAFDLPILQRGTRKLKYFSHNYIFHYFIQPRAETYITDAQYWGFVKDVARQGYWFTDPGKRNAGYYRAANRIALIDPWAVVKLPQDRGAS
jgi:hypothetical protein